jgi:prevent-host-death family protein
MKKASVSETKNRLSALLELVRQGETVLILDRNRPVARLEPAFAVPGEETDGRLAALERKGIIRRARKPLAASLLNAKPPKLKGSGSVLKALLAEREEGR